MALFPVTCTGLCKVISWNMEEKTTWNSDLTVEGMSQIISPQTLEIHQSAHMTSGSICHLEPTSATPKVVTYSINLCAQLSPEISAGKEWDIS